MKLKNIIFIFILILLSSFAYAFPCENVTSLNGNGTKENPYLIYTCCEFQQIDEISDITSSYYSLENNISCIDLKDYYYNNSDHKGFIPIGIPNFEDGDKTNLTTFSGVFEGNNFTISDIYMTMGGFYGYRDGQPMGLFRILSNANISNLRIKNYNTIDANVQGVLTGQMSNLNAYNIDMQDINLNIDSYSLCPVGSISGITSGGKLNKISVYNMSISCDGSYCSLVRGGILFGYKSSNNYLEIDNIRLNNNYASISNVFPISYSCRYTNISTTYYYGTTNKNNWFGENNNCNGFNNYWLNNSIISPNAKDLIIPIVYAENITDMKKQNTYSGFDFNNIWDIDENITTPYFKTESNIIKETIYNITNCSDLNNMYSNTSANYQIVNDIDCSGYSWTQNTGVFYGNLDGNNYTIYNLDILATSNYGGIFGRFDGGIVENLRIDGANLNYTGSSTYCGLVAGRFDNGIVRNVKIYDSIVSCVQYVGAVAGLGGYITGGLNMSNTGAYNVTITTRASGSSGYGGLVGNCNNVTLRNVYTKGGKIDGAQSNGGICGVGYEQNIFNAYSYNDYVGSSSTSGAGLVLSFILGTLDNIIVSSDVDTGTANNCYAVSGGDGLHNQSNSFYNSDKSCNGYDAGKVTPKTSAQLRQASTYPYMVDRAIHENLSFPYFDFEELSDFTRYPPVSQGITYPTNSSYHSGVIGVNWADSYDMEQDLILYSVYVKNETGHLTKQAENLTASYYALDISAYEFGVYEIIIQSFDSWNNSDNQSVFIIADNQPPQINISYPLGLWGRNAINLTATDDDEIDEVYINSTLFFKASSVALPLVSFVYNSTSSFNGSVFITANDTLGNMANITKSVIFDVVNPICIMSPSQELVYNTSYNIMANCSDDIKLRSFSINCSGGLDDYKFRNLTGKSYYYTNTTGALIEDTFCKVLIIDYANNTRQYTLSYSIDQPTNYMDFDLTKLTNVMILGILVFAWLGCLVIGMAFKNFGFMSFGFFIGIFLGLVLANIHFILTLVFLFMNIAIWYSGAKTIGD